jgi:hypothetical protein
MEVRCEAWTKREYEKLAPQFKLAQWPDQRPDEEGVEGID